MAQPRPRQAGQDDLMDVDGTLTDGRLSVLPDGEGIKSYNVKEARLLPPRLVDI